MKLELNVIGHIQNLYEHNKLWCAVAPFANTKY